MRKVAAYGRAKIQRDPSMRSYTLDLELGRLAAASHSWSLEEGIEHLSLLWRYTLLQCSLASRADNYPEEAFQFLLLLRQEAKAIGLAELLTDPSRKVQILLQIANHLAEQSDRKVESDQLLTRANEVAKMIEGAFMREEALNRLGQALAQAGQWERAEATIIQIEDAFWRGYTLSSLGQALAQAGQWERAEATIVQIEDVDTREEALFRLIDALSKVKKYERGLVVVQHSWLKATTRDEALALLQIANPFIVLKPDLGVALLEAFPWVDNFLKG